MWGRNEREDAPHCKGDGRGASTVCTVQPPDGFFSSSSGLAGTAKSKRGMSADSYVSGDRAATHETPAVGSGAGELWRWAPGAAYSGQHSRSTCCAAHSFVGCLAPGVNLRNLTLLTLKLRGITGINLKQTAGCRGQPGGLLNRISSFCPLSLPPPASDDRGRTGRTRARRRSGAGCRSSRAGCRAGSRPTRARDLRGEAGGPSA